MEKLKYSKYKAWNARRQEHELLDIIKKLRDFACSGSDIDVHKNTLNTKTSKKMRKKIKNLGTKELKNLQYDKGCFGIMNRGEMR